MNRTVNLLALCAVACGAAFSVQAQCVSALAAGTSPITTGHLAFQGVRNTGGSFVYVYDFTTRTFADTTHWRRVVEAHNPSLSHDGKWIVFYAPIAHGLPSRVWAWRASLKEPIDLTTMSGGDTSVYNEDPKFAPDDKHIVFKEDGAIALMTVTELNKNIAVSAPTTIVTGMRGYPTEASGPVLTFNNKYGYFYRDIKPNEHIERVALSGFTPGADLSYGNPSATESYYPAVQKDGTLYFVRHTVTNDPDNPYGPDMIYTVTPHTNFGAAAPVATNLCSSDNSDPAPDNAGHLIFSSKFAGRYQLYVGDVGDTSVWNFSDRPEINKTAGALQGASYAPR